MAILLTGGAGYLGSHTAVELLAAGCQVIIADNFSNSSPKAVERIRQLSGKPVGLYQLDVADPEALEQLFCGEKIDAVLHFAGRKAIRESVLDPLRYYYSNLTATLNLLRVMDRHQCHNLIYSSSALVYSPQLWSEPLPINEDAPTGDCSTPYAWSVWMNERILQDAARADERLSVVLLRYFNPVGAHPSGRLGEAPSGAPNNLMPYITQAALGQRPWLAVFGNDYPTPDGTGVRDYLHVQDLAQGHVLALDYARAHSGVEAFNLGAGRGYSVLDVVKTFSRVNQVMVRYRFAPRREGDAAVLYSDPAKAQRLLGWQARLDLSDMCRDAWRWQVLNPQGFDSPEQPSRLVRPQDKRR